MYSFSIRTVCRWYWYFSSFEVFMYDSPYAWRVLTKYCITIYKTSLFSMHSLRVIYTIRPNVAKIACCCYYCACCGEGQDSERVFSRWVNHSRMLA